MAIYGPEPEPFDAEHEYNFDEIKRSQDQETWRGRACVYPLPGGGNDPTGPGASPVKGNK